MISLKKLMMSFMEGVKKGQGVHEKESVERKPAEEELITEEDILKAIDNLPLKQEKTVKVPTVGIWSQLEYLHKPDMHGLDKVKQDDRLYFTIPVGWTYDDEGMNIQYWYITFPVDGSSNDITEFYSHSKIDEISFPGVD